MLQTRRREPGPLNYSTVSQPDSTTMSTTSATPKHPDLQHLLDGESASSQLDECYQDNILMTVGYHPQKDRTSFLYRFVKRLLFFCGQCTYVDYFQTHGGGSSFGAKLARHLRRRPWWASLAVLNFAPTIAFMFTYIAIHYYHDLYWYKYNKFAGGSLVNGSSSPGNLTEVSSSSLLQAAAAPFMKRQQQQQQPKTQINSTLAELEQHVSWSRSLLESMGAQYLEAHFTIQAICLFCWFLSLGVYLNGMFHFGFKGWLNFTLARLMIDCEREQREYSALIRQVLANYIASSENYMRILLVQAELILGGQTQKLDLFENQFGWSRAERLIANHRKLMQKLVSLARGGHFQPLEWADGGAFMRKLYQRYGQFVILIIGFYLVLIPVATVVMTSLFGGLQFETPNQLVFVVLAFLLLFGYAAGSVAFFVSLLMVDHTQQAKSMDVLRGLTASCLQNNSWRMQRILGELDNRCAASATAVAKRKKILGRCSMAMNVELMGCFLHFKLFAAQFNGRRYHSIVILVTSTGILFLLPVMFWLHLPYTTDSAPMLTMGAIFVVYQLILYNAVCFPSCYLHAQSLKHYKQLNSLAAHVSQTLDLVGKLDRTSGLVIYDKHLVWLLRKELNHPHRLLEHFSIAQFGLRFTYAHLIRVHFWYGFGMLNLLCRSSSDIDALLAHFIG